MNSENPYFNLTPNYPISELIKTSLSSDIFKAAFHCTTVTEPCLKNSKFSSFSMEQLVGNLSASVNSKQLSVKKLMHCFRTYAARGKQTTKLSLGDEIELCLQFAHVGLCVCIQSPIVGVFEDIGNRVWTFTFDKLVPKMDVLVSELGKTSPEKAVIVKDSLIKLLHQLVALFFHSILMMLQLVRISRIDAKEEKVIPYFVGFFATVIGDIEQTLSKLQSGKKTTEELSKRELDFYHFAIVVWPRCGRPFRQLSKLLQNRNDIFEAVHYNIRSFLCLSGDDRFVTAREELGGAYDSIEKSYNHWSRLLEKTHCLEKHNFLATQSAPTSLIVVATGKANHLFALSNFATVKLIKSFKNVRIKILCTNSIYTWQKMAELLYHSMIYAFLLMVVNIILRYNGDMFESLLEEFSLKLDILLKKVSPMQLLLCHRLNHIMLIVVYTFECSLVQVEARESCEVEKNSNSSLWLALVSSIKVVFAIMKVLISILTKPKKRASFVLPSIIRALVIVVRSLLVACQKAEFSLATKSLVLNGDQFFLSQLYEYLKKFETDQIPEVDYLPELKLLGNSMFMLSPASEHWNKVNLENENKIRNIHYIKYLQTSLTHILSSSSIFFKIENDRVVFDRDAFKDFQCHVSYEEFRLHFMSIRDDQTLIYMLNYVLNICTGSMAIINYIGHIVPDTNAFLSKNNSILNMKLFESADVAIPITVIHELENLQNAVETKGEGEENALLASRAEDCIKIYQRLNGINDGRISVLSNEGELYHASMCCTNVVKPDEKCDDLILKGIKNYYNKYKVHKNVGRKGFDIRPAILVTNDTVMKIKALSNDITCIDSQTLKEIDRLLNLNEK